MVPPAAEHRADWERLYAGYAAFYGVEQTAAMRATVWGWLHDAGHEVSGLLALDDHGRPVGLSPLPPLCPTLAASTGGFLDDLFVDPEARGSGAAQALIDAVAAAAGRAAGR